MADSTSDTPVNTPLNPTNPSTDASGSADVKPAIRITLKKNDTPAGVPTAQVVENTSAPAPSINLQKAEPAPAAAPAAPASIDLQKAEPAPAADAAAPASSTIQLKKPASTTPTIQLKKPESSTPTIQLKKPENEPASDAAPAKKVGEAPIPPERKLTLKIKNQPSKPQDLPKNIIPGLNIPTTPPPVHKDEEEKKDAPAVPQQQQPPVAAPVQTQTPVPEAAADGKKKKGKLPKVKKQPAAPSSADEPNWFFLTLSCLVLIAVCFVAYILFAQYMNMYEEMQIPIPGFLMPK